MSVDCSSSAFLAFLREAAVTGRMRPATARSRRKAAEVLFERLTESEAADLRRLDIGELAQRFHDDQSPQTRDEVIELYAERLATALDEYLGFSAERAVEPGAVAPRSRSRDGGNAAEDKALEAVRLAFDRQKSDVLPVPLGPGRIVYIHGLPPDLSAAEAARIGRILEAYAVDATDDTA
jgi:hypothetical protein